MSRRLAVKSCTIVIDGGNLVLTRRPCCFVNILDSREISKRLQIARLLDLPVYKDHIAITHEYDSVTPTLMVEL